MSTKFPGKGSWGVQKLWEGIPNEKDGTKKGKMTKRVGEKSMCEGGLVIRATMGDPVEGGGKGYEPTKSEEDGWEQGKLLPGPARNSGKREENAQ